MICPNCSAQLAESSRTCAYCGTQLPTTNERLEAGRTRLTPTAPPAAPMTRIVPTEMGVVLPLTEMPAPVAQQPVAVARPRSNPRLRLDRALIAIVVLSILLLATGGFAYATSRTLDDTRGSLSATQLQLDSTKTSLSAANTDLDTTKGLLTAERSSRVSAQAQVTQLQGRVAKQDQCIQAMNDSIRELGGIQVAITAAYNNTATGSRWATASAARQAAVNGALDAYYQAYLNAFNGQKATANSFVASGNVYLQTAKDQIAIMNAEVAANDQATAANGAALTAYNTHFAQTKTACGL